MNDGTHIINHEESPTANYQATAEEGEEEEENIMLQTEDLHVIGAHFTESHALMNFIKGNIGTGMLSMPIVMKFAGLWTGFFMLLIAGFIATYLMNTLVRVSRSVRAKHNLDRTKMDYTETVFHVFKHGPEKLRKPKGKIKHTVNLFLIVTQIGFSCVYTLFITENIRSFIRGFNEDISADFYLVAFFVCLCLTPLSLWSSMRIFALIATIANIATLIGVILIFAYLFTTGLLPVSALPVFTDFKGFLIAFGIVMFSFEGISLVLPIESKMTNPVSYIKPYGVLNTGMIIIICLNTAVGFFGYLAFGDKVQGSITLTIPQTPYWFSPVKPLFIIAITGTYIMQFYVPASIFSRLMEKIRCHREASDRRRYIHLKLMRIGLVAFAYLMVITIPKLELMISLIGALASSVLAFILPPILELVHLWEERHEIEGFWWRIFMKHVLIIMIGMLSFIGGTVATVMQLIEAFRSPDNS